MAVSPWDRAVWYGFLESTLDVGGGLEDSYALGFGPSLGLLALLSDRWKLNLFARYQQYALGDTGSEREIGLEQSYAFNGQNALRLHVKYAHDHGSDWGSVGLAWHIYF